MRSPRRCTASPTPTTTGRARRRSRGSRTSRVPTLVLNARNDPFVPAASLPRPADVSADVVLEQPGAGRARRASDRARSRAASIGCRDGCSTSSSTGAEPATSRRHRSAAQRMTPAPPRDLQGLRHPRHRRQDADARRSCARSARRSGSLARERGRDTIAIGRDGRLSGPELAAALADGIRAAGADVIDIGMVATPMTYFAAHHLGTGSQRDGHRQPQSARLQRPQDGGRRHDACPATTSRSCARASSAATLATGAGDYRTHDIAPAYLERIAATSSSRAR